MINHGRTLLLNATQSAGGFPGEELIPEAYRPVQLNGALRSVRAAIFGAKPDRIMLNYRAQQLLAILHASELKQYLLDLDPRITYQPEKADGVYRHAFTLSAYQTDGPDLEFFLGGAAEVDPDTTGICRYTWLVYPFVDSCIDDLDLLSPVLASSPFSPCIISSIDSEFDILSPAMTSTPFSLSNELEAPAINVQVTPGGDIQTYEYTTESDLTSQIPLAGTGFYMQFRTPFTTQEFRVTADVKPRNSSAQILKKLDTIGEPSQLELFGVGSSIGNTDPMKTCYRLWKDSRESPYRLAAATFALIYQTEQARLGRG